MQVRLIKKMQPATGMLPATEEPEPPLSLKEAEDKLKSEVQEFLQRRAASRLAERAAVA